jgi:tungstate transport system ATP-binding protein
LYNLKDLKHIYDQRHVLDIPSFQINRGEILAVIGPSGAGKSTLLRLLNFLELPTRGQIHFEGQLVTADIPIEQRRRVTTVFQHPVLLKRSVAANLKFGLALRGKKLTPEQKYAWLQKLGLEELEHQVAAKLSAGEAQRLAVARALLTKPDVLLLDEPTANLDPQNVRIIEEIVREENQQNQTTIVIVTHNIFQARRLSHRTALLFDGMLIEAGETEKFFSHPNRPETEKFIHGDLIY